MTADDLPSVAAISAAVHGDFAEPQAIYAERLALYPAGCWIWETNGQVTGFLVTHPWHRHAPPALGASLGAIPEPATTYYLHDIALLPDARGSGAGRLATQLTERLARQAGQAEVMLVAVNGADRFWAAQGFTLDADAPSYGPCTYMMRRSID